MVTCPLGDAFSGELCVPATIVHAVHSGGNEFGLKKLLAPLDKASFDVIQPAKTSVHTVHSGSNELKA